MYSVSTDRRANILLWAATTADALLFVLRLLMSLLLLPQGSPVCSLLVLMSCQAGLGCRGGWIDLEGERGPEGLDLAVASPLGFAFRIPRGRQRPPYSQPSEVWA